MKAKIDPRLLEPGWGGEISPDELAFLHSELTQDKRLAFQWGFQPAKKRRPAWAVLQVAEFGDPNVRATNMGLARRQSPSNLERKGDFQAQRQRDRPLGYLGGRRAKAVG